MNLNPKIMVYDDVYNVKYRQPDTLYKPVLFKPLSKLESVKLCLK